MSTTDTPLRFGVIGVGWQGGSHLQNLAAEPRARLTALCDINTQLLAERATTFGVEHRFTDYRDLVACNEVDAVIVALPDYLHRDPAVAALEAGKHLLLEKPMALSVADAEAIATAAERSSGRFMLNLSNRWMPAFAAGKTAPDGGKFGQPRYFFARMANRIDVPTQRLPWLQRSHLAHWIGIHRLDIARWYAGREIVRVRALHRRGMLAGKGFNAGDLFQATLEFDGGAVMSLEGNWILPPSYPSLVDSRFYCLCDNGVIDVDRSRSELAVKWTRESGLGTFDMPDKNRKNRVKVHLLS